MKRIAYLFLAAISLLVASENCASAETRPHYGGTLRVMLQSAPHTLDLPTSGSPADYRDLTRTLSLIGDTLITLDAEARAHPALAASWQSDASARYWKFTLRHGVKFHDDSAASPAAIAQILGAIHPSWNIHATADSISVDSDNPMPSLLAELASPRNLILKRNVNGVPIGTGTFLVAQWQPGKSLKLAANEDSWAGRPFVDFVAIEFGKSLHDQAIALELDKTDVIETAPPAAVSTLSPASSLPVELLALVFPPNSRAQDHRLREALALAIDRKPIQSVLLKGVGEPAATILPNWMTGYTALFSTQANLQRARALLADSQQPALNLSYDPTDPQAELMAERIALNAREIGVIVQVSLSGAPDIRLMRIALPSPDPVTSLSEAARQLGLPPPTFPSMGSVTLDDLYRAEKTLLDGYAVIPLFHLPVASAANRRVIGWQTDRLGEWNDAGHSLADLWLEASRPEAGSK